jgi:predicted phosphate transport protein (TIGR00153 family)
MANLLQALMPRENRFFELFAAHSRIVVAGAHELRAMLDGGDEIAAHCKAVLAHEAEADAITRDVLISVRRTFITPFDRGDIKDLITAMDDAIDEMQHTAQAITLFDFCEFAPEMRAMGDAIVECAGLLQDAVPLLRNIGAEATRIGALCERITHIEGQADDIHNEGLRKLYRAQSGANPMAFITGQEVYGHLESVVDRFDDVGNEIQSIVLEQV